MPKKQTKKEVKAIKKETVKKVKAPVKKTADLKVKEKKVAKAIVKEEKIVEKADVQEKKTVKASKPKKTAKTSGGDTGSVDFQVSNFSAKIASLAKHLKIHPHDFDSRRGLLIMVGKRRRLLNYVKKDDMEKYEKLSKSLKLKV